MRIIFETKTFSITSALNRKNTPHIDGVFFHSIKDYTLGKKFELSLVFIGAKRMKALNSKFRKKTYATDILTFTLEDSGEIFIYPTKAYQKAKLFDRKPDNYIEYLFVHGIAHLLGHDHEHDTDSKKMDSYEARICKKFDI